MDYKALLIKYLAHVADVNGDTLTYNVKREADEAKYKDKLLPYFTHEEEAELDRCEKDAFELYPDIN
jgi:hypothetical protein